MFAAGAFSADASDPLRVDAEVLASLPRARLEAGFQVTDANPMVCLEGRADLLRHLGHLLARRPDVFALQDRARPGGLFDRLAAQATNGVIAAPVILSEV